MRIPSPVLAGNKSWGEGLLRAPYHREPSSSDPTCHQVPLPEEIQVSPGDTEIHRVEPEDVANHLTAFHWELFRCVHEVGLRLVLDRGGGGWGARAVQQTVLVLASKAPLQHTRGQCTSITSVGLCPSSGKTVERLSSSLFRVLPT